MSDQQEKKQTFPPQHQEKQPGVQSEMRPEPQTDNPNYRPGGKLKGKVAVITGGDSGIGRAVATVFAKEGASVAIIYLDEHQDARDSQADVEKYGQRALLISGDISQEEFCKQAVEKTVAEFGQIDILVNNAAMQFPQKRITEISAE